MDNLTPQQRRRNMQRVRASGTQAELLARRLLRKNKLYFATNVVSLPGKPDIVFRKKRIAVFIDSDFWHCHPTRFTMPKSNAQYWVCKIAKNVDRDRRVDKELASIGWKVIRIWEYDLLTNPGKSISRVIKLVRRSKVSH